MVIQLSFLWFMVSIAVASTKLIYHDGVSCQFERMASHCRMLAILIIAMTVYSGSIGFSIHEQCMREIQQKDSKIKAMAQEKSPAESELCRGVIVSVDKLLTTVVK